MHSPVSWTAVASADRRPFFLVRQRWAIVLGTMDERMKWEYLVREFNVQDSDKILLLEEFLERSRKRWLGTCQRCDHADRELHASDLLETWDGPSRASGSCPTTEVLIQCRDTAIFRSRGTDGPHPAPLALFGPEFRGWRCAFSRCWSTWSFISRYRFRRSVFACNAARNSSVPTVPGTCEPATAAASAASANWSSKSSQV